MMPQLFHDEAEWARSRPGVRRAAITGHTDVARSKECGRRFRRQMRRYRACSVLQHARGCEDYPHREREYAGEQRLTRLERGGDADLPIEAVGSDAEWRSSLIGDGHPQ